MSAPDFQPSAKAAGKACLACGEPRRGADAVDADGPWLCSVCAELAVIIFAALKRGPKSIEACLDLVRVSARDLAAFIVRWSLAAGALELRDDLLHLQRPPAVPAMRLLGEVEGCQVWSPGTFTAGEGWGPVREDLAAAVTNCGPVQPAAAPSQLVFPISFDPPKESS